MNALDFFVAFIYGFISKFQFETAPLNMKAKVVFISYKAEEFDNALWVKNVIESNGISCWMAPMCISGGASYADEIPKAIRNCKIFVLILSQNAQESKWIPRELDQAINSDKLIMPFALENCALKTDFEFYLSNVQRYSAYLNKEAAMAKMLEDIKNRLGYIEPEIQPIPTSSTEELAQPAPTPTSFTADSFQSSQKRKVLKTTKKLIVPEGKNNKKKSAKNFIIPAVIFVAVILVVILGAILSSQSQLNQSQKIEFADMFFNKDEHSLRVEDKDIDSVDMEALAKFENLMFLEFTNCTFSTNDLSSMARHGLLRLTIENCNLTHVQLNSIDFSTLDTLCELNLNGNEELTSLEVISPLAKTLDTLCINNTSPYSLELIKNFDKIKRLSINQVGLSDLSFVKEMAYLEELCADGNEINTLNGLENTTILSKVSLKNNRISDVSILANSAATLKYLYLDNNSISDLSALAACRNIIDLSANSNQLTSVQWLTEWSVLRSLSLANNKIETIEGFVQSENLTYIDISNNKLTKIGKIGFKRDSYVKANFSHNAIASALLDQECHYSKLALHGNPLKAVDFLTGIKGSEISFSFFEELDAESLKEVGFYTLYIADCPTNRKVELERASYAVKLTTAAEIDSLIFGSKPSV